jgi:hypothetical protein
VKRPGLSVVILKKLRNDLGIVVAP